MASSDEKAQVLQWKRDPEAFGVAYDAYFDGIFSYILNRVANATVAEDLAAQTFYTALTSPRKYKWSSVPVPAWLYRIATNEVNGYFRRKRSRNFLNIYSMENSLKDDANSPDEELAAAEEEVEKQKGFLKIHDCIRQLKPIDQSLIVFRYFESKPFSEIALILGKREGALRMRCVRALEKLKLLLQERGICHEKIRGNASQPVAPGSKSSFIQADAAAQASQ